MRAGADDDPGGLSIVDFGLQIADWREPSAVSQLPLSGQRSAVRREPGAGEMVKANQRPVVPASRPLPAFVCGLMKYEGTGRGAR